MASSTTYFVFVTGMTHMFYHSRSNVLGHLTTQHDIVMLISTSDRVQWFSSLSLVCLSKLPSSLTSAPWMTTTSTLHSVCSSASLCASIPWDSCVQFLLLCLPARYVHNPRSFPGPHPAGLGTSLHNTLQVLRGYITTPQVLRHYRKRH